MRKRETMVFVLVLMVVSLFMVSWRSAAPEAAFEPDEAEDTIRPLLSADDLAGFTSANATETLRYLALAQRLTALAVDQDNIHLLYISHLKNENPFQNEIILSFMVSPMSGHSQSVFDTITESPDVVSGFLTALTEQTYRVSPETTSLPEVSNIGDAGTGYAFRIGVDSAAYQVDFAWVRRGTTLQSTWIIHPVDEAPSVAVADLAAHIDQTIQERFPGVAFRQASEFVPQITTTIPTVLDVSTDPEVITTNVILTALLMIPFAAASEIFSGLLAEKESSLSALFRKKKPKNKKRGKMSVPLGFLLILVFYGVVFSLLDQSWQPLTITGLVLFLQMTFAYGIIGLAGDIIQWRKLKKWGVPAELSLQPLNTIVAVLSTVASRLIRLAPGLMFGAPETLSVDDEQLNEKQQTRLLRADTWASIGLCLGLWALTGLTNLIQAQTSQVVSQIAGAVEAFFLVIFAVALENFFVQMLGFPGGCGEALRKKSRFLWLLALSLTTFLFYHTLINPLGEIATTLQDSKVWILHSILAVFLIVVVGVWLSRRIRRSSTAKGKKVGFFTWAGLAIGVIGLSAAAVMVFSQGLLFQKTIESVSPTIETLPIISDLITAPEPINAGDYLSHPEQTPMICFVHSAVDEPLDVGVWNSINLVAAEYGARAEQRTPETSDETGYCDSIEDLINDGCEIIIGDSAHQETAFNSAALAYEDTVFLIVGANGFESRASNLWVIDYDLSQGFYLAGYLTASISKTGRIGVFSTADEDSANCLDCFVSGISDYDTTHQQSVAVLGWDVAAQNGLYVNSAESPEEGYAVTEQLIASGADVILARAGTGVESTAYGAAQTALHAEAVTLIGVNEDWALDHPEISGLVMTSIIKQYEQSIALALEAYLAGGTLPQPYTGDMATGEVRLAALRGFTDHVPESILSEISQLVDDPQSKACLSGEMVQPETVAAISTVEPTIAPSPTPTNTPQPTPTPDKGIYNPDNGHWYKLIDIYMPISEAISYCQDMGAHMVSIANAAENLFVFNISPNVCLGGSDAGSEGNWYWYSGEPWGYTNWNQGEPTNSAGYSGIEEHYLAFDDHNSTTWNDIPNCGGPFICEWDG